MIDFYIVKPRGQDPSYDADSDIGFATIDQAREQVNYCAKNSNSTVDDWWIIRIKATDKTEIVNCFYGGMRGKITKWKQIETLAIFSK